MVRDDYIELYTKEPTEIINYLEDDMMKIMASTDIDDNTIDKIAEWRYILLKIQEKLSETKSLQELANELDTSEPKEMRSIR